MDGYPDLRPL